MPGLGFAGHQASREPSKCDTCEPGLSRKPAWGQTDSPQFQWTPLAKVLCTVVPLQHEAALRDEHCASAGPSSAQFPVAREQESGS